MSVCNEIALYYLITRPFVYYHVCIHNLITSFQETSNSQNMEVRGVNPYESVVAMARRFGEMGAAKVLFGMPKSFS